MRTLTDVDGHPPLVERAWANPLAMGVGALAACVLVTVHDPNQEGSYGFCPFKAVTGWDCPGCGLMRGSHAVFTGNFTRALDHNIFLPLVFAAMIFGYVRYVRRSLGHDVPRYNPPAWLIAGFSVLVLGFWVVRNLGGPFAYLDSAAG